MATQKTLLTAEDLLRMPDDGRFYELLDGVLVEVSPPGAMHGGVSMRIGYLLTGFVEPRDLGRVLADVGVILRRNPDRVRAPDVCFLAQERIPEGGIPRGYLELVPDLIVEVISPNDRPGEVERKVQEWLQAGARLVWAVNTDSRTVAADQPGVATRIYREADVLTAAPVLSGLSIRVADLFA